MKIFISGVSGVGKTTLAKSLSKDLNVPFIETSAKVLWDKYNIKTHAHLIEKTTIDKRFGVDFQNELLDYRQKVYEKNDSFITDRSPLDNLVYYLLQVSNNMDSSDTLEYLKRCSNSYPKDKYIQVYLSLNYNMAKDFFENDGFRVNNIYYQLTVDSVFKMIISGNWLDIDIDNMLRFSTWDFEAKRYAITSKVIDIYG